jgi:hypothetical protein
MSLSLLAGVSTASVSLQLNYTTVKVKGTFLFQSHARSGGEGRNEERGVEEVRLSTSRCSCETGLLDVDEEKENLSAEVVNLFLASSFSGKRSRETP